MYIDDDMLGQLVKEDSPRGKKPHLEHQDKLYNGLLAIEAVIGSVEMYASHETTFKAHLHAVKEMLDARIDWDIGVLDE